MPPLHKRSHQGATNERSDISEQSAAHIASDLESRIGKGELLPGERVKELPLAQHYHVTRATVHEALKRLEADKLVDYTLNRGYSVSILTSDDVWDVYRVREVLEGLVARLFATEARPTDITKLRDALSEFETAVGHNNLDLMVRAKDRFYDILYVGCRNVVIIGILKSLRSRILWLRWKTLAQEGRPRETLKELTAICQAVTATPPNLDEAEAVARAHVRLAAEVADNELHRKRLADANAELLLES